MNGWRIVEEWRDAGVERCAVRDSAWMVAGTENEA